MIRDFGGRVRVLKQILCICLLLAIFASSALADIPTTLPSTVASALDSNARQLDPITVALAETVMAKLPEGTTKERKTVRHLTWQDGKLYCCSKSGSGDKTLSEFSFDGKLFYSGTGDGGLVTKSNPDSSEPFVNADYFILAGVSVPTTSRDMLEKQNCSIVLQKTAQAGAVLWSIEPVTVDGNRLLRVSFHVPNELRDGAMKAKKENVIKSVRTWSKKEEDITAEWNKILSIRAMPAVLVESFYLDPQLNHAVRKFEQRYEDGRLLREHNNSSFERLAGRDLWMPRRCIENVYFRINRKEGVFISERSVHTRTIDVTSLTATPVSNVSFALEYTKPGTMITDRTDANGEKAYRIPIPVDIGDPRPWYRRPHVLFFISNAVAAVCLAAYYRYQRCSGRKR